jgi:nitrite reductase/ring-hydroxylating ferredoxin subunit
MDPDPGAGSTMAIRQGHGGCLQRREFLHRGAAALAVGVLMALGADRAEAEGLPVRLVAGTSGPRGGEISFPVPDHDGVLVDADHAVVLVRYHDYLYGLCLRCTHQPVELEWRNDEAQFECPKHHARFRPDGEWMSGRQTRSMDRNSIRLQSGTAVVDLDCIHRQDEDRDGWGAARVPAEVDAVAGIG